MTATIYTVVEALVAFMSVWSVIGLAGFHSYLVCCNITTNEDVSFLPTLQRQCSCLIFSARCNIYISRLCHDASQSVCDRSAL